MKMRYAFLGCVALAALAAAIPQEVLLRRTLQAKATDVYGVEMDSKSTVDTPMGEQEIEIKGTMTVAYATGEVKDGKADVEIKTSDMKFEYGGLAALAQGMMGEMPKEIVVKAKMDERNRITEAKLQGADAQRAMLMNSNLQMSGQTIEFPEKAVKVGDTWEVSLPKDEMMGTQAAKLTAKLLGEKENGYAIQLTGVVLMSLDLAAMAKKNPKVGEGLPTQNVKMTGSMDLKLEGLFEKATGKTIRMTSRIKQKTTTTLADQGMTIDSTGETVIKITLK